MDEFFLNKLVILEIEFCKNVLYRKNQVEKVSYDKRCIDF